jgi:phage tail protein X
MLILKQSTSIDIRMGPFVDATDAVTPETGITLAGADQAEVLKANGAATVTMAGTFAAVTGADGWYDYTVAAGDVDTVGEVVFVVQDLSVCLPVYTRAYVVEEAVYDAMYGAASAGPLQSTTAGRTLDVTATGAAGIDWANVEGQATAVNLSSTTTNLVNTTTTNTDMRGTDNALLAASAPTNFGDLSITVTTGRVDVGSWLGTAVTTSTTTAKPEVDVFSISDDSAAANNAELDYDGTGYAKTNSTVGTVTTLTGHTAQTGDNYARLGAPAGVSVSADIAAVQSDTDDIQTRIPAALVGGRIDANMGAISADATAADNLEASAETIVTGTAQTGTLSTTQMTTNLSEATDDHYIGRTIIWRTGVLLGQATDITDYTGTNGLLTFTAVTEAPSNGDTFIII